MSGTTCAVSQGGSTVSVFCENGCCASDCCKDPTVDTDALAIALSVLIAFLILLALIAIIIYCCLRRKKNKGKSKKKKAKKNRNEVVPLSTFRQTSGDSNVGHSVHKFVQTGDPNPVGKDRILWGLSRRWSNKPARKQPSRKKRWGVFKKTRERSSQTVAGDFVPVRHFAPHNLDDDHNTKEKGVQTPGPKVTAGRGKKPDLPSEPAPKKPWRPSAQHKSLTTPGPSGVDTYANYTGEFMDPGYSIHRCVPDYVYDSDISRSQSIPPGTARTVSSDVLL